MATPALVQSVTASATATSVSTGAITPVNSGNAFIVYGFSSQTTTTIKVTDNINIQSGQQYFNCAGPANFSPNQQIIIAAYFGISGSATTVTLNCGTSAACRVLVQEWINIDSLLPYDQGTSIASGTSAAPACNATGTLLQNGELVVGWFRSTAGTTWTAGSGFTLDTTLQSLAAMAEYQIMSGTSAVTANISASGSVTWGALAAAFRPQTTRKVIAFTSGTTFNAPPDWPANNLADKAEVIGGGGAGRNSNTATNEGTGGGGGAYCFSNNLTITSGASMQVGQGGTSNAQNGTASWIVSTGTLFAPGGNGGAIANGGTGGSAASCVPAANGNSGGTGGSPASNATAGATGGGGAGGPYGNGAAGGGQNTGTTGGTGGGASGGGSAGVTQTASNSGGTNGGTYSAIYGQISGNGGVGGAAGGANAGGNGNGLISPQRTGGSGGGGGGSDGAGNGGSGGAGGGGGEWSTSVGGIVGSGGGGGGTGQQASGGTPPNPGNGGLYGGGGGGGGGKGTFTGFGQGAGGLIVITYQPGAVVSNVLPIIYERKYVQFHI